MTTEKQNNVIEENKTELLNEGLNRDSFVFYTSFYDALSDIHGEEFEACIRALADYALTGKTRSTNGVATMFFTLIKPQIDSNNRKYTAAIKGAKTRWDSYEKNDAQDKKTASDNTAKKKSKNATGIKNKMPMASNRMENSMPNDNVNENVNVNVNENVNVNVNVNDNVNVYENAPAAEAVQDVCHEADGQECDTHTYGEHKNVILTDDEYRRLLSKYGSEILGKHIEFLSAYMKRKTAYKSDCHFEDLRGWVEDAVRKREGQKSSLSPSRQQTGGRTAEDFFKGVSLEDLFEKP